MASRAMHRLSAADVKSVEKPGRYADGGNLYLHVAGPEAKSWLFIYTRFGKTREMGLGSLTRVSLSAARKKAADARQRLGFGVDPLRARKDALAAEAQQKTFKECAEAFIESHRSSWKNAKHASQWTNTLTQYAYPVIGDLPVEEIELKHLSDILLPIWTTKNETANRVRGRIEQVLDWAAVKHLRPRDNPARWRGTLDKVLAKRSAVHEIKHHGAVPHEKINAFVARLRESSGMAALALEFVILTATRVNEALQADWSEFDLDARLWTIPASRMKAKRVHRVPLSHEAIKILRQAKKSSGDAGFVFPSPLKEGKALSGAALLALVKEFAGGAYTTHGFRSTFRDWAATKGQVLYEVAEAALAHKIKDKTERAYLREDFCKERIRPMQSWATYCNRSVPSRNPQPPRRRIITLRRDPAPDMPA
jgi:integrase